MKPLALIKIVPVLTLLFLASATLSWGQGRDRGIMQVEFLYSIETTGGRGEKLKSPTDIFFDRHSRELYVTDVSARKILVFNADGAFLQEIKIDSLQGAPSMVAMDGDGRLYVGHIQSAMVSILTYKGDPLEVLELPGIVDAPGNQVRPLYFAEGPAGEVYALKSKGGIVKIDPFGEKHQEMFLNGEDAPNMIYGMTVDPQGRFIFSDMRPYSLVIYDPRQGSPRRFGTAGILYGQLARPQGLTTDDTGHIFVTSLVRNKVLCYDRDGNFIEEFGGLGRGYGQFYMPTKIVSDGRDRIYVLEEPLKRVQVFRISFPQKETTADTGEEAPGRS
jgi:tripartite motif-containing protein 71